MSSNDKKKYTFPSGKFYLDFRTAIITGVARSGKTTLGKLLATSRNVEYSEEPWILNLLSAMTKLKMISGETGKDMFVSYLHELMNDMILLRQANFRPDDDSSIWTKKTEKEIMSRLVSLQTRSDVKDFVKKNRPIFLLILRESPLFNLPAIFGFLPDCKIIHVVRKGTDVARQIKEKGWLSDKQLIKPPHARIYYQTIYKNKPFYIPCWIDSKDRKKFIGYSEYERGLFYWCTLMEKWVESFKKLKNKEQCMVIKFEELAENPKEIMRKAGLFFNMKPSPMAKAALSKVKNYKNISKKAPELPKELLARTKRLYKHFKYGWD